MISSSFPLRSVVDVCSPTGGRGGGKTLNRILMNENFLGIYSCPKIHLGVLPRRVVTKTGCYLPTASLPDLNLIILMHFSGG